MRVNFPHNEDYSAELSADNEGRLLVKSGGVVLLSYIPKKQLALVSNDDGKYYATIHPFAEAVGVACADAEGMDVCTQSIGSLPPIKDGFAVLSYTKESHVFYVDKDFKLLKVLFPVGHNTKPYGELPDSWMNYAESLRRLVGKRRVNEVAWDKLEPFMKVAIRSDLEHDKLSGLSVKCTEYFYRAVEAGELDFLAGELDDYSLRRLAMIVEKVPGEPRTLEFADTLKKRLADEVALMAWSRLFLEEKSGKALPYFVDTIGKAMVWQFKKYGQATNLI